MTSDVHHVYVYVSAHHVSVYVCCGGGSLRGAAGSVF